MIRKILFVAIAVALLWEAAACSPGADSGSQKVVARAEAPTTVGAKRRPLRHED